MPVNRLVSWADVQNFVEMDYAEDDASGKPYARILDDLTTLFESYCGRLFSEATGTETVYHIGLTVPLKRLPVTAVTSVTVDGVALVSTDYRICGSGILLKNGGYSSEVKVDVAYTGGYTVTTNVIAVPDDVKHAALLQLQHEYKRRKEPGANTIETNAGTIRETPLKLLDYVKEILNRYRHPYTLIGI